MSIPEIPDLSNVIGETGEQIRRALGLLTFTDAILGDDAPIASKPEASESATENARPRKNITPRKP
jgi:hypothetical protein